MLINDFNKTIDIWIIQLQHYSFRQLCAKPDSESWSLGQVFMHLINETQYYMQQMEDCLNNNENAGEEMTDQAKIMFLKNEFPNEKIKGDKDIAIRIKQPVSKLQLEKEMQALKSAMNNSWAKIFDTDSIGKTKHPGLAYFSAQEWFQYAEMHLRHHLRQKERIDEFLQ